MKLIQLNYLFFLPHTNPQEFDGNVVLSILFWVYSWLERILVYVIVFTIYLLTFADGFFALLSVLHFVSASWSEKKTELRAIMGTS